MAGILQIFSKSHRQARRNADRILNAVLAQARLPVFYEAGGVADTVTGRFDLLAVHAFLVMRIMKRDRSLKMLNQTFLDALFSNIDSSFREVGVSDTRVPRKMRQAAEAFYGRLGAYETGLNEGGLAGLKEALGRNLFMGAAPGEEALDHMARYMIGSLGTLSLMDHAAWNNGKLRFAAPRFGGRE